MQRLKHSQLDKVICQIAYEPWFSIDSDIGRFQQLIGTAYPITGVNTEPGGMQLIDMPLVNNYRFSTRDGAWTINVTRSFIALTSSRYTGWFDYKNRLRDACETLLSAFGIGSYTRVGLRYINAIRRSSLGFENIPWSELINPALLGMASSHEGNVKNHSSVTELAFDDDRIRLSSGLISFNDDGEQGFLIDCDVFTEKEITIDHVETLLDSYNRHCWEMFEESVSPKLLEGMR